MSRWEDELDAARIGLEGDFCDGELIALDIFPGSLTLQIELWNARLVQLEFMDWIQVNSYSGLRSDLGKATIIDEDEVLSLAKKAEMDAGASESAVRNHRLFRLLDCSDEVALEIVAEGLLVTDLDRRTVPSPRSNL